MFLKSLIFKTNFKLFILVFCFSIFFTNQIFCTNSTNSFGLSCQEYYKNNSWEYLEKAFIDEPRGKKLIVAVRNIFSYLGIGTITALVLNKYVKYDKALITYLVCFYFGFLGLIFYEAVKINGTIKIDIDALKKFLTKYNPVIKEGELNTKVFVPKEFGQIFDSLYETWQKEGDSCLNKEGAMALNLVKEKIMFHVNPAKYNPMRVNG
ncbi:hypothetical protein K9M16_01065 [Candidatus Babeliales bacterium]|nr:hypothetical protein [Candidatus Babeliales bacterium]